MIRAGSQNAKKAAQPWTFALYYIPGLFYLIFNTAFAQDIARSLNTNLWATQMYITIVLLFTPMLAITYLYLRCIDGFNLEQMIDWLGLTRFNLKNLLAASLVCLPFIAFIDFLWIPFVKPAWKFLDTIPLIKMPSWFWQNTIAESMKTLPLPLTFSTMALVIVFNHFCEEIYFRGFLFRKTEGFFGRWTPVVAGLLFISYHVFQIPKTWPVFPVGIFICYVYYSRRDLYSVILAHLLLNLFIFVK